MVLRSERLVGHHCCLESACEEGDVAALLEARVSRPQAQRQIWCYIGSDRSQTLLQNKWLVDAVLMQLLRRRPRDADHIHRKTIAHMRSNGDGVLQITQEIKTARHPVEISVCNPTSKPCF